MRCVRREIHHEVRWHGSSLIGEHNAAVLRDEALRVHKSSGVLNRRFRLLGRENEWEVRITAAPEPAVKGEPPIMAGIITLIRVEA